MTTIRSELQQKAQSVILQYAILRWESAVIIAVTIVHYVVSGWLRVDRSAAQMRSAAAASCDA